MIKVKAVYTVELALLMPVILLTVFLPLHQGLELHHVVKEASIYKWEEEIQPVKQLRKYKKSGDLLGGDN